MSLAYVDILIWGIEVPRPPRIEFENAWYHVMNRGAGRRVIFPDDEARLLFIELLKLTQEEFQIQIHAYCLMGNHFHLLVRTPNANLNLAMQKLSSLYTRRHNQRAKTDGPLFRGRYKAILIAEDDYLAHVSRYIHRNPVEAKMVQSAEDYEWSSFRAYCDAGQGPNWLNTKQIIATVSPQHNAEDYRRFVNDPLLLSMREFYEAKQIPGVLGGKEIRRMLASHATYNTQWLPKNRKSVPQIIRVVSKAFNTKVDNLLTSKRGQLNIPRATAMYLAHSTQGFTAQEIGSEFHISASAVSQNVRRLKMIVKEDDAVADKINNLKQVLVSV